MPTEIHKEQLKKHKLKATPARLRILSVLEETPRPLSIQSVREKLEDLKIDQATVYRTLNTFHMLGLVKTVDFQHGHSHYELTNRPHHHHLVCTNCGAVEDVQGCRVVPEDMQVLKRSGFASIEDHSLEFFGTCKKCDGV